MEWVRNRAAGHEFERFAAEALDPILPPAVSRRP